MTGKVKDTFWDTVKYVATILALMGAFYGIDGRYAKSEDMKKQEQQTVKTLEMFQDKLEQKYLRDRLDSLKDQSRQIRILQRKEPNDIDLKDQAKDIESEIGNTKKRLTDLENKK